MINVQVVRRRLGRVSQGDVLREVECIEAVAERRGILEVSKIVFPLVVVLTQDCDLEQDAHNRAKAESDERDKPNQDKRLFSVLVAPLYNAEHVFQGTHLSDLGLTMQSINRIKTPGKILIQNEVPRYHYLDFPPEIPIVPSIIDFKHYFSIGLPYLERLRPAKFVCRLSVLFREDLSQRFSGYLARIGLPDITKPTKPVQARAVTTELHAEQ